MRNVYEACEDNTEACITDWVHYKTQEAQLDRKIHMLRTAEVDPKTRKATMPQGVLAGPNVYDQKWIYKLKTKGNVALRPMLCLGPRDLSAEWTFLARAVEKGGKLMPSDAASVAEARRIEVVNKTRDRFLIVDHKP